MSENTTRAHAKAEKAGARKLFSPLPHALLGLFTRGPGWASVSCFQKKEA